jgi:isopenicillin N synthase-like dioxygenase
MANTSQSKRFFDLPPETKTLAPHPPEGWWHRGYSGLGREKIEYKPLDVTHPDEIPAAPDVKESFEMGREDNPVLPNIWLPESALPGFRAFFNDFYYLCHQLELRILRALEVGMALQPGTFVDVHQRADNQTRILHYPPVERKVLEDGRAQRISAHSDFGTLTLLFQDGVGGLEVEHPKHEGYFVPAPGIQGTVVVNLGDFMQMWSNDVLKSTKHRVRAPPAGGDADGEGMLPPRYSIPYFCAADMETVMECLDGCWGVERPKKYKPTSVGEYINMRLNANY